MFFTEILKAVEKQFIFKTFKIPQKLEYDLCKTIVHLKLSNITLNYWIKFKSKPPKSKTTNPSFFQYIKNTWKNSTRVHKFDLSFSYFPVI